MAPTSLNLYSFDPSRITKERNMTIFMQAFVLFSLLCVSFSRADPKKPPEDYGYSQSFSLELTSDGDDLFGATSRQESFTTSSLLFPSWIADGSACYVSSMALMADADYQWKVDHDDMSSEDDNNDDDNDGSCSMLSNASLFRRAVSVGSSDDASTPGLAFVVSRSDYSSTSGCSSSQGAAGRDVILRLRGGSRDIGKEALRKLFVVALTTLIFEGTMGHVMEFLKIAMQTGSPGTTYDSAIREITSAKGITGLWDGFLPWGVVQALFKGAVFGLAHSTASDLLVPLGKQGTIPMSLAMTSAGAIGGAFQGYVLSPTLLLKTRVMTNPIFREKMSLLKTTWLSFLIGFEVVQKEGLLTLMKGANIFALKRCFDWATRYFFSDWCEATLVTIKGGALSVAEKSAASFIGGVASTLCTLPLDVLVAKTQDSKKAGVKVSAWKLFRDELKEKGWSGLRDTYMQGFEARLLHVCTTTMVIKTGTPIIYDFLYGKK